MARYHLKYRKDFFPEEVIEATEKLFDAKPWRLDLGQLDLYQRWADVVSEAYGAGPVGVQKVDLNAAGFGYELALVPNIILGRYSLASLFCGMGLHIHAGGCRLPSQTAHIEWGFSLFYVVRPVMFRRRAREGRLVDVTAKDTFTRDTWNRLERMGLTMGDFLVDSAFDIRTLDADDDLVSPDDEAEAIESADSEVGNLAPVIEFNRHVSDQFEALRELPVEVLRRMSRGVFSGGYRMPKEQLIRELVAHGITRGEQ